jgi:UDP-N-acetylmuramate dehydrogenase
MIIEQKISLKALNTFGLEVDAENLICIVNENVLHDVLKAGYSPLKIIGGGSNILLTNDVSGFVLLNQIKGIQIIEEDENKILVQVGAGEKWHQLVLWALSHDLGGIENLSLIPGSVGAAPMQNIGAYGVEQDSVFHSLQAIHLESGVKKTFSKSTCNFGYRESIFKNDVKDQYFITHVSYLLTKKNHQLHLEYGAIRDVLSQKGITHPTIQDISAAIIEIRQSKLPDPRQIGNAGSFFKNPIVSKSHYEKLKLQYNEIPSYPVSESEVKVPAGWLIEKIGYKGKIIGNIGVHKNQALVLVNYGGGSGKDIENLAIQIQMTVFEVFGIKIQTEVNIL